VILGPTDESQRDRGFMVPLMRSRPPSTSRCFAGHSTIRPDHRADFKRAAGRWRSALMAELLRDAMVKGLGLASDLRNEPASFSTTDELAGLGSSWPVRRHVPRPST
jgi:hypothetical protein